MVSLMENRDMIISWAPCVWSHAVPVTPSKLRAAKQRMDARFSQDYADCVLQHKGQTPEPCTISFGDGYSTVLNELYHFADSPST